MGHGSTRLKRAKTDRRVVAERRVTVHYIRRDMDTQSNFMCRLWANRLPCYSSNVPRFHSRSESDEV